MALFKKKNKEPRVIKEDDSLWVKLWYNKRTHAMIVLGLYLLFFLIIIIVANIVETPKNNLKEISGSNLKDKFDAFNEKNISYNFVINNSDDIYYFSGEKDINGTIKGKLLHNNDIDGIIITDGNCIVDNVNNEEEKSCPDFINYDYFYYQNIYENIKDIKIQVFDTSKTYTFETNNKIKYIIYTNGTIIKKIDINDNKLSYSLNYLINEFSDESLDNNEENVNIEEN